MWKQLGVYGLLGSALVGLGSVAWADDDEHSSRSRWNSSPANPAWQAECSACHIAYPPQLLPAASWRKLMTGLDDHFGQNASLDANTRTTILAFLEANSGRAREASAPLRITETAWFTHEHDEIGAKVWQRPAIGSASRCEACHQGAAQGDFDEDRVRIPR